MPEILTFDEMFKDLLYEFAKSIGLIWLIKKIPLLELKDWAKLREKKNKTNAKK